MKCMGQRVRQIKMHQVEKLVWYKDNFFFSSTGLAGVARAEDLFVNCNTSLMILNDFWGTIAFIIKTNSIHTNIHAKGAVDCCDKCTNTIRQPLFSTQCAIKFSPQSHWSIETPTFLPNKTVICQRQWLKMHLKWSMALFISPEPLDTLLFIFLGK